MADRMAERHASPAYQALRASTRRLLKFVENEIARGGGGRVTFHNDTLEMIGTRRIYLPGLCELATLGFVTVERYPKRHVIGLSDRWREVATSAQAWAASAAAREQGKPPLVMDTASRLELQQ